MSDLLARIEKHLRDYSDGDEWADVSFGHVETLELLDEVADALKEQQREIERLINENAHLQSIVTLRERAAHREEIYERIKREESSIPDLLLSRRSHG